MSGRRVLVLGAAGRLGRQIALAFGAAGDEVVTPSRADFDIVGPDSPRLIEAAEPAIVVNAAAWTDVDGCALDPVRANDVNGNAPGRLAVAAAAIGATFLQISSNEVFDGSSEAAYTEEAVPNPINPYGASKLLGERGVAAAGPDHLIVRTAWIFGPAGPSYLTKIIEAALRAQSAGESLAVVADEYGNPTWAPHLAASIVAALEVGARGLLHLAGEPPTSRIEWAETILKGTDVAIRPIPLADYQRPAPVPARAILSMETARRTGIAPMDWRPPTSRLSSALLSVASQ